MSARQECDGSIYCKAEPHLHGCYAERVDRRATPEQEIAKLKHAISALIPWVASSGRGAAQEALANACELIGIDPLSWSAHPDVLLRRRPDLDRRASERA